MHVVILLVWSCNVYENTFPLPVGADCNFLFFYLLRLLLRCSPFEWENQHQSPSRQWLLVDHLILHWFQLCCYIGTSCVEVEFKLVISLCRWSLLPFCSISIRVEGLFPAFACIRLPPKHTSSTLDVFKEFKAATECTLHSFIIPFGSLSLFDSKLCITRRKKHDFSGAIHHISYHVSNFCLVSSHVVQWSCSSRWTALCSFVKYSQFLTS